MPTALLTLGRLPKALTLARALKSRGYRVVVAEPFKWHVARASSCVDASYYLPPPNTNPKLYRDTILALIQHESVDLLVPVSEEAHHVLPLAPQLPENVELIGPAHQLYQELSHKLHFIEKAAALGLRVPATFAIDDPRAATLARDAAHVKKPVRGCSGIEVSLCDKGTTHDSRDSGYVIQEQIVGQPVSTLSLVRQGSVVGTSIYEGRVFAGTVAVGFERCLPGSPGEISVRKWVDALVDSLDYEGFIAFDFIVDKNGLAWPIECNPRLTSGIHFFDQTSLGDAVAGNFPLRAVYNNTVDRWQWGYSSLTEAYAALFKGNWREALRIFKWLASSRDVVWSWRDPLPFLLMTPLSWPILKSALFKGMSLGEACQRDIAPLWETSPGASLEQSGSEA
ncbi:MAG: ATP-grasp domain-containing protein [Proteobacteria bacterium]|nr:ATP-grasp domain-containing protein [Pseudomonadota bacterium]